MFAIQTITAGTPLAYTATYAGANAGTTEANGSVSTQSFSDSGSATSAAGSSGQTAVIPGTSGSTGYTPGNTFTLSVQGTSAATSTATLTTTVSTSTGTQLYTSSIETNTSNAATSQVTTLADTTTSVLTTNTLTTTASFSGVGFSTLTVGPLDTTTLDHYLFESSELAWAFAAFDTTPGGVFGLEEIADQITGNTYRPPVQTTLVTSVSPVGSYIYPNSVFGLATLAATLRVPGQVYNSGTITAVSSANAGAQVPTPGPADTYTYLGYQAASTIFPEPVTLSTGVTSASAGAASGASSTDEADYTLALLTTQLGAAYDSLGNVTGTTAVPTTTTAASSIVGSFSVSFIDTYETSSSYSFSDADAETSFSQFDSGSFVSGLTQVSSVNLASSTIGYESFYGRATVLQATHDPGYSFGSGGDADAVVQQITGGGSDSWYYPFFSEVQSGVSMPMTYPDSTSLTLLSYTGGDSQTVYSFSYSWGTSSGSSFTRPDAAVSISSLSQWMDLTATPPTSSASTSLDSGSTALTLGTSSADPYSFFNLQNGIGSFILGGRQWGGGPQSAWLGRGIWLAESVSGAAASSESESTSSETIRVTGDYSSVTAGTDELVVYTPLLAFSTVTHNGAEDDGAFNLFVTTFDPGSV